MTGQSSAKAAYRRHSFAGCVRVSAFATALASLVVGVSACSASGPGINAGGSSAHAQAPQSTTPAGAWCAFYTGDNPTTDQFVAQLKEFASRAGAAAGKVSSDDGFVNQYTVARAPAHSATDMLQVSPPGAAAAFTRWFCTAPDARHYQVSDADAGGPTMNKVMTDSAVFSLAQGLLNGCVYTDGAAQEPDPARREMLLN